MIFKLPHSMMVHIKQEEASELPGITPSSLGACRQPAKGFCLPTWCFQQLPASKIGPFHTNLDFWVLLERSKDSTTSGSHSQEAIIRDEGQVTPFNRVHQGELEIGCSVPAFSRRSINDSYYYHYLLFISNSESTAFKGRHCVFYCHPPPAVGLRPGTQETDIILQDPYANSKIHD